MRVLQAWLLAGIPSLALALAMFVHRSPLRSFIGYAALAAGFAVLAVLDRASAAVFGTLLALLYAAGRGAGAERTRIDDSKAYVPDVTRTVARDRGGRPSTT